MTVSDIAVAPRWRLPGGLPGTMLRYGASASGPVAVSAAHFLASLIFLRQLPAREFGLFSFVMVVVSFAAGSKLLLVSALAASLPFGASFFRHQVAALRGDPWRYRPIFRDVTRWSLIGVVLTELTLNAHAYLVTFISGPGAFALLALGMLLMRPASLMQSALTDLERPTMARAIGAKDSAALARIQRYFTFGLGAAWT